MRLTPVDLPPLMDSPACRLPQDVIQQFSTRGTIRVIPRGTLLFEEGAHAESIFIGPPSLL